MSRSKNEKPAAVARAVEVVRKHYPKVGLASSDRTRTLQQAARAAKESGTAFVVFTNADGAWTVERIQSAPLFVSNRHVVYPDGTVRYEGAPGDV